MPMRRSALLCAAVCLAVGLWPGRSCLAQAQAGEGLPMPLGAALKLTMGLQDKQPTDWSGELRLAQGRVLSLAGRPQKGEEIAGASWKLRTRKVGRRGGIAPVTVVAVVEGVGTSPITVATAQGSFSLTLAEFQLGQTKAFLGGAVTVQRLSPYTELTADPTDDDFPACAAARDGTVWCAYIAYQHGTPVNTAEVTKGKFDSLVTKGNGDQLRLLYFDGKTWRGPINVTDGLLDIWRPAVAVDGQGRAWVVWSQNVGGNWDLFCCSVSAESMKPSKPVRVTTNPGADINVVAATDRAGNVWIAWQGWNGNNFDIWVAALGDGRKTIPLHVSTSAANDWCPAIACAPSGAVWVAWDTYDAGNYDVLARKVENGKLSPPVAIATSPRFEARPNIVVDSQDRLWVAFEDGPENWGKDYGDRWEGEMGVPFYLERNIIVRCVAARELLQTKATFRSELIDTFYDDPRKPTEKKHRISIPRLALDDRGRVWLLFRRHPLTSASGERWVSFATYYDGNRWAQEIPIPQSYNLLDNRPALVALPGKGLLVVYSTDYREAGSRTARDNNICAALLSVPDAPRAPQLVAVSPERRGQGAPPVHRREAEEVARVRTFRVHLGGKTYRLLRGEFHRHTELSSHRDWDGPFAELWRYGLDVAAMDWIGPGDHDYGWGREYPWWLTQKQTEMYHHPPLFVPVHSYERSVPYPSGHRNVIFPRRGIRALPRYGPRQNLYGTPEKGAPDIKNLYAYLKYFGGICASHTSATGMGTDWRDNDPLVEPVVEIYQGHRQSYEEPGAPKAAKSAEESIQGYHPEGFVWNALAKGFRLGFESSSDHVSTHTSYAFLIAEDNTREAIIAAFKQRHCYAANDNIILDVRCGDHIMGDEFTTTKQPALRVHIEGTAPIARVDVIRQVQGESPVYVYNIQPNKSVFSFEWLDNAAKPGQVYMYYVRVIQQDTKMVWGSPMWVHYGP